MTEPRVSELVARKGERLQELLASGGVLFPGAAEFIRQAAATMKPGSCGKRLWKRPRCPGPMLVLPAPIRTWAAGKAGGCRRLLNWRVWWILP